MTDRHVYLNSRHARVVPNGGYEFMIPSSIYSDKDHISISIQSVSFRRNWYNISKDVTYSTTDFEGAVQSHTIEAGNYSIHDLVRVLNESGLECTYNRHSNRVRVELGETISSFDSGTLGPYISLPEGTVFADATLSGLIDLSKNDRLYLKLDGVGLHNQSFTNICKNDTGLSRCNIIASLPLHNRPFDLMSWNFQDDNDSIFQLSRHQGGMGSLIFTLLDQDGSAFDVGSDIEIVLLIKYDPKLNTSERMLKSIESAVQKCNETLTDLLILKNQKV